LDALNAFISQNAGLFFLLTGSVAVAAAVVAVIAFLRLKAVTRPFVWLSGQWDGQLDSLPALLQTVEKNAKDLEEVHETIRQIKDENMAHFKRVGLVRYDAFDGVAGQQSYSLCLLDGNKNGILLSNLVGREFSRSYAVEIAAGEAPRKLGSEEGQALELALRRTAVNGFF
jgi:hypothetical protein